MKRSINFAELFFNFRWSVSNLQKLPQNLALAGRDEHNSEILIKKLQVNNINY